MCKIKTENFCEGVCKDKELFDLSNQSINSKYCNNANKLVVIKMKDEACGVPMKGFVELKFEIYTFITEGNHESKKRKRY